MVPSRSDFLEDYSLDFVSNYVAEKVIFKAFDDGVQVVSEFARAQAVGDSGWEAVVRGKTYEILCHRWFGLPNQRILRLRSLNLHSQRERDFTLKEMLTIRFLSLDDIKAPKPNTYYWPTSKTFCALDAFFITGKSCFGLQMTRNENPEIKAAPLNAFLEWLKCVGIAQDQFYFVFVVPNYLAGDFSEQTIENTVDEVTQRPGAPTVNQYVAALDVFMENSIVSNLPEDAWRYQLQPGQLVDTQDTHQTWCESRVVAVHSSHVKLHSRGWTSKWDEWIERTLTRIAQLHSKVRNWRAFNIGDPVMVGRHVTTQSYPEWINAEVTACKPVGGCLWIQVDSKTQWIHAQDEMLSAPEMHRAVKG